MEEKHNGEMVELLRKRRDVLRRLIAQELAGLIELWRQELREIEEFLGNNEEA